AELSFATGLALHDALAALTGAGDRFRLKWPNDMLLEGAKLSGMLLESATGQEGGLEFLVIGLGVNLTDFPTDVPYPATSVAAGFGTAPGITEMLEAFLPRLSHWMHRWERDGFEALRDSWLARAAGVGERITVRLAHETLVGTFAGLRADGALDLILDGGASRAITAGDIFLPGVDGVAH
ncbi:MAG: biotin/lipoate--protein ligase family protein, partial [Zavarzinia sp.]|nr:biotin/lipoate--protein ligase family protein [Zavarzinia sp.]